MKVPEADSEGAKDQGCSMSSFLSDTYCRTSLAGGKDRWHRSVFEPRPPIRPGPCSHSRPRLALLHSRSAPVPSGDNEDPLPSPVHKAGGGSGGLCDTSAASLRPVVCCLVQTRGIAGRMTFKDQVVTCG